MLWCATHFVLSSASLVSQNFHDAPTYKVPTNDIQDFKPVAVTDGVLPPADVFGPRWVTSNSTQGGAEEEEVEPTTVFYFMFISLLLGTLTYALQHRYHLKIPYTVLLFVEGCIIGGMQKLDYFPLIFSESVEMWVNIDPELILFAFLPALLFGDAMGFTWHVFKRAIGQCVLLAGPGVLFGFLVQAPLMRLIVPSWKWDMCLAFGSIISATDPVAVVALLKDLGVDRMLTMQVAGESLLNDGVAIVVWTPIQLYMVATYCIAQDDPALNCNTDDATVTPRSLSILFFQLAICGCLLGKIFGWVTVLLLSYHSDKMSHSSSTIQLSLSICCAYLSFYVGQSIFGVSGVLCCIFAGVFCAQHAGPIIAEKQSLESVWHLLEFGGNTLLFILAGTIFGLTAPHEQSWTSWVQLLFTYLSMMAIRLLMLFLFFPMLKRIGVGCNKKDLFIMWWGGLRGAVGLSLALYMRRLAVQGKIEREYGEKCVWLVAGCAALTLVINATTCSALVDYLNVRAETPQSRQQLMDFVQFAISKSTIRKCSELRKMSQYSAGWVDPKWVARHISAFRRRDDLFAKLFVMIADNATESHLNVLFSAWREVSGKGRSPNHSDAMGSMQLMRMSSTSRAFSPRSDDVESLLHLPPNTNLTLQNVRDLRTGKNSTGILTPIPSMEMEHDSPTGAEMEMRSFSPPLAQSRSDSVARYDASQNCANLTQMRPATVDQRLKDSFGPNESERSLGDRLRTDATHAPRLPSPTKPGESKKSRTAKTPDLVMERELFLSMLRCEYWAMIRDGRLPERSEAGQVLLQSVDSAEDSTRWTLSDLLGVNDCLRSPIRSNNIFKRSLNQLQSLLYAIFVETPARGAGFKRFVPCRTHSGRVIDLFTVIGFLDAHLAVSQRLSGRNGSVGYVTEARREVLWESSGEVESMWHFLDSERITSDDVVAVRTKQLCSMLLRHEANEIEQYYHSGLIKQEEYNTLLTTITSDFKSLIISKHAFMFSEAEKV